MYLFFVVDLLSKKIHSKEESVGFHQHHANNLSDQNYRGMPWQIMNNPSVFHKTKKMYSNKIANVKNEELADESKGRNSNILVEKVNRFQTLDKLVQKMHLIYLPARCLNKFVEILSPKLHLLKRLRRGINPKYTDQLDGRKGRSCRI